MLRRAPSGRFHPGTLNRGGEGGAVREAERIELHATGFRHTPIRRGLDLLLGFRSPLGISTLPMHSWQRTSGDLPGRQHTVGPNHIW